MNIKQATKLPYFQQGAFVPVDMATVQVMAVAGGLLIAEVKRLQEVVRLTDLHSIRADQRSEAAEAENSRLKTALAGRTYCHSDAAVEQRCQELEAENAALRKVAEKALRWLYNGFEPDNQSEAYKELKAVLNKEEP